MVRIKRCVISSVVIFIVVFGLSLFAWAQQAEVQEQTDEALDAQKDFQIWKNKAFTRNSFDEDIRDVLKAIARNNDSPITFGEGITDTITMDFRDMPLKNAFKYIVDRYGLSHYWDADSIHVYKPDISKTKDVLIRLINLKIDEVKLALVRFGLIKKELKIVFDSMTNTILLTGTEREIENIKNVIEVLESTRKKKVEVAVNPEIRYYPLTYARVDDTQITVGKKSVNVKGVVSVLTEVLNLTRVGEKRELAVKTDMQKGKEDVPDERVSKVRLIRSMIETEAGTIASDARTNQIIIRDYPEKLNEYTEIIKQLDQPVNMVKIELIIVEAGKDFAREFGIGYAGLSGETGHNIVGGGTSDLATSVITGAADNSGLVSLDDMTPYPSGADSYGLAGTFLYQAGNTLLTATLAATESRGVSKTINKSSIITMDNMQAIMQSSETITYKLESGGDGEVKSEQIDSGIIVTVTPHIIGVDTQTPMIELVVEAERSSFRPAADTTSPDGIPDKLSTDLSTQAVIGDGNTLVIGGLFNNKYSNTESGIPCLMNLPALGYLFKTASAQNPKSNILFFLTPQIISLDSIPYQGGEISEKIKGHEEELKQINSDKREKLIEQHQN